MNHLESFTKDAKGVRIKYQYWEESSKSYDSIILVLPAEGYHSGLYGPLIAPLLKEKYKLYAMDLPGFGKSEGTKGGTTLSAMADAVEVMRKLIQNAEGVKEIILLGHGLGGVLATSYLKRYPDTPMRVVALSPTFLNLPGTIDPKSFSTESSWVERLEKDPLFVKSINPGLVSDHANILSIIEQSPDFLKDAKMGVFVGESDPVVPFEALREKLTKLGFKTLGFKSFPRMCHDILQEIRSDQSIAAILAWLSETRFVFKLKH